MKENDRVRYIPYYANGDTEHRDCETGTISGVNDSFVFVKFDKQVSRLGWEETTAQACYFDNLFLINHK